jgi:hypothetical protein
MKKIFLFILILANLFAYSQTVRFTNQFKQTRIGSIYYLQKDSSNTNDWRNIASENYVIGYVATHGGIVYTAGSGISIVGGAISVNSISGLVSQGSNVTITGSGTILDPYVINSTGAGGAGSNSNVGSAYRWALPNTQSIKTFANGYGTLLDSLTANTLTIKIDTNLVGTKLWRQKGIDSLNSVIANYALTSALSGYVPITTLVSTGYGLLGGGQLNANRTHFVDTSLVSTKANVQKKIDSIVALSGITSLPVANTLFVSKSGSDATGIRGRLDKPFLTIRGALNAASSGDLIMVYPGTYEETSPISLAKGVNYSFIGNGTVQLNTSVTSGAVFTDSSTVATSVILGGGWKFEARNAQLTINQSAASTLTMFANEIVSGNGRTINTGTNAITTITANRVAGNAFAGTIWLTNSAKFIGDIKSIEAAAFGDAIWTSNAKYVNIHAQRIFVSDTTNDDYLILIQNSNATDSIYIEAQEMKSGTEWALWAQGLSPAIQLKAQHISAKSDCVVVSSTSPGGAVTVQADVIENTTTGAMDGIVHGEGGTLTVIGAKIIRNSLSTGNDVKTVIFGGDTGYVKLIAVSYDRTKVSAAPAGTITRIDNFFENGLGARTLTNTDSVAYVLGYDRTTQQFVTVVKNSINSFSGALVVALTDAATISTDASQGYTIGSTYRVTLGGNRTIANPTNLVDGQRLVFEIKQDGTGSRLLTWGSMFTWSDDIPLVTLSTSANYVDQVAFVYNASAGKLYVTGANIGVH